MCFIFFKKSFNIKVTIHLLPKTSKYVNSLRNPTKNIGVRVNGAEAYEENKNGFHPNPDERIFDVSNVKPGQKLTILVGEENGYFVTKEFTVEKGKLNYLEEI